MATSLKQSREPKSFSIDTDLVPLLEEYCTLHSRNQSDAVNLAIKTLLAIEKAKDPAFWVVEYSRIEEEAK